MIQEDRLKAAGMESCARHYRDQLLKAQRIAVELARIHGTVTSDDVREEALKRGLNLSFSKNWSGSVWKGKDWIKVGYVPSRHPGGHGRVIAQWKLDDGGQLRKRSMGTEDVRASAYTAPAPIVTKPVFETELFELPKTISDEFLQ